MFLDTGYRFASVGSRVDGVHINPVAGARTSGNPSNQGGGSTCYR